MDLISLSLSYYFFIDVLYSKPCKQEVRILSCLLPKTVYAFTYVQAGTSVNVNFYFIFQCIEKKEEKKNIDDQQSNKKQRCYRKRNINARRYLSGVLLSFTLSLSLYTPRRCARIYFFTRWLLFMIDYKTVYG